MWPAAGGSFERTVTNVGPRLITRRTAQHDGHKPYLPRAADAAVYVCSHSQPLAFRGKRSSSTAGTEMIREGEPRIELKLTSHLLPLAVNWNDAKRRVLKSYRDWIRAVRVCPPGLGLPPSLDALAVFSWAKYCIEYGNIGTSLVGRIFS